MDSWRWPGGHVDDHRIARDSGSIDHLGHRIHGATRELSIRVDADSADVHDTASGNQPDRLRVQCQCRMLNNNWVFADLPNFVLAKG
jgi:hypothetical protein